jgi:hypothetical protein
MMITVSMNAYMFLLVVLVVNVFVFSKNKNIFDIPKIEWIVIVIISVIFPMSFVFWSYVLIRRDDK